MTLSLHMPESMILKPQITVFGVGGAGCNATNNMIKANLEGANFVVANTDAQALEHSVAEKRIQLGRDTTRGLGAGASPEVGRKAAEEALEDITGHMQGSNMVFITAGMGGGTGTGAAPVVARAARDMGILTVGVVTKPFHFEGPRRMRLAEEGLEELQKHVDTLIIIPNQNLFRVANERTTFAEAFAMADAVLHAGVRGITDLMVMPGLINLDFADVRAVMSEMGKAMMGTGEAEGDRRASEAAEAAISNPLLDNVSMKGARGVLINITGGSDMTLFEVDEAANRIREEVDPSANIIFGSTFSEDLKGKIRVSVVATGIDSQHNNTGNKDGAKASKNSTFFTAAAKASPSIRQSVETLEEVIEQVEAPVVEEPVQEELLETATQAAYQQLKDEVERTFTTPAPAQAAPAPADRQYYDAIRSLNEEYQASQGKKVAQDQAYGQVDAPFMHQAPAAQQKQRVFMAPQAAEPASYAHGSTYQQSSATEEQYTYQEPREEEYAMAMAEPQQQRTTVEPLGSIFSKMASRVARSFQGESARRNDWNAAGYDQYVEEPRRESESGPVAASSEHKEELLDIPAYLRRKA